MPPYLLHIDDALPSDLAGVLGRHGVEVRHTSDPEEAMRLVDEQRPGLVIMEIACSGFDGPDLMYGIRDAAGGEIPVLVVTQLSRDSAEHGEAIALGCVDFLTKPVPDAELLAAVSEVLPLSGKTAPAAAAEPDLSGTLAEAPAPELLMRLRRRGASGALSLHRDDAKIALQIRNGTPVGISSTQPRRGPKALLCEAFRWTDGEYRFFEGRRLSPESMLELDGAPAAMLMPAVLKASPPRVVRDRLSKRESLYAAMVDDWERELEASGCRLSGRQKKLLRSVGGEGTLAALLSSRLFEERQVYALWVSGWLELRTVPTLTLTELMGPEAQEAPEIVEPSADDTLERLRRTRAQSERELEELARAREERERELEELARVREQRLRELDEMAEARRRVEREREAIEPALEERVQELAELERARDRRAEELEALAEARARHEEELAELARAREESARRHDALAPALRERAEELNELERERRQRADEVEDLARTRDEYEHALDELARTREARARELEALTPALEERERELQALAAVREEHEHEIAELTRARAEHADELEELARERADHTQELEELARARSQSTQELEELAAARATEAREVEALRKLRTELEEELDALERRVETARDTAEASTPPVPAVGAPDPDDTVELPSVSSEPVAETVAREPEIADAPEEVTSDDTAPLGHEEPDDTAPLGHEEPDDTAPLGHEEAPGEPRGSEEPEETHASPELDRETLTATIRGLAQGVQGADDFQVLGVGPDATDADVERARRAKLAEVPEVEDNTANLVLYQQASRVRSRIQSAYENLRNAEKRRAYSLLRDEEAEDRKVQSSAERAVEGERWFHKGKTHLDAKRYAEATEAFGMASHLDPEQGDYLAHLGYALYLTNPDDSVVQREALENLAKGIKRSPQNELAYVFLGRIHKAKGEGEVAKKIFNKALALKPGFLPAVQELRVLEMRERKGKGVLSRLIGG